MEVRVQLGTRSPDYSLQNEGYGGLNILTYYKAPERPKSEKVLSLTSVEPQVQVWASKTLMSDNRHLGLIGRRIWKLP